jgi:hypothetical protein
MTLSPLLPIRRCSRSWSVPVQGSDGDFLIQIRTACEGTNLQG